MPDTLLLTAPAALAADEYNEAGVIPEPLYEGVDDVPDCLWEDGDWDGDPAYDDSAFAVSSYLLATAASRVRPCAIRNHRGSTRTRRSTRRRGASTRRGPPSGDSDSDPEPEAASRRGGPS